MGNIFVFIPLALIALTAAVGTVTSRNAIHSALFLILNMATLAAFYVVLQAPFIAMAQVAVYAGAIMVLFLFVIMLLGAEQLEGVVARGRAQVWLALLLGIGLIVSFGAALFVADTPSANEGLLDVIDASPVAVGLRLFENYVFPFEVTSLLLLVAMIGVVVLRTYEQRK
ncbi:MAG: NADH-quinone oxidoreductase subunit J [Candidatus Promineifilaceae bacterium]|nr:NADH-quinone oxidoreductase subunit J [Candidatus Promineifilaceae bacterium]